jgi:hypothetical protein
LLGLFAFGILTRRVLNQKYIWAVCIIAPLLALGIDILSSPEWYEKKLHVTLGLTNISNSLFNGYKNWQRTNIDKRYYNFSWAV